MEKIITAGIGIFMLFIVMIGASLLSSIVIYITLPTLIKVINVPCITERLSNISFWDLWICNIALAQLFSFMRSTPTIK